MLPNLSGLKNSSIDVKLLDLPEAILAKTLDPGTVQELCSVVDNLARATKQQRDNRAAWMEIAARYRMPGRPSEDTAAAWREFVRDHCRMVKPGEDVFGYSFVHFATDRAVWLNQPETYAWIHSMVESVPLSWVRTDLNVVARSHGNVRFFETGYDRLLSLPDSLEDKSEFLNNAVFYRNFELVRWLFIKLLVEANYAVWPNGDAADLAPKREKLKRNLTVSAYRGVANRAEYREIIPFLRAIREPHRAVVLTLMKAAIIADNIDKVQFLDAQFVITREEAAQIETDSEVRDKLFYDDDPDVIFIERLRLSWAKR